MKLLRKILFPFVPFYYIVVFLKNKFYDWSFLNSSFYDFPLICVGNLSVGGTGKSPMVEYLVSFLKNDGLLVFDYKIEYENFKPYISEKAGTINLWHKNFNGTWTINLYYINRILKAN